MVLGLGSQALPPKPKPRKGTLGGLTLASLGLAAQQGILGTAGAFAPYAPAAAEPPQLHNWQQGWPGLNGAHMMQQQLAGAPPPPSLQQRSWLSAQRQPAAEASTQRQQHSAGLTAAHHLQRAAELDLQQLQQPAAEPLAQQSAQQYQPAAEASTQTQQQQQQQEEEQHPSPQISVHQQHPAAGVPAQQPIAAPAEQPQPSTHSAAGASIQPAGPCQELTSPGCSRWKRGRQQREQQQQQAEAGAGRGGQTAAAATAAIGSEQPKSRGRAPKRRRRSRLVPDSSGVAAAAAATLPTATPADLVGAVVEVPGSVFSVPDKHYVCTVIKPERKRGQAAVEVRFVDGEIYWFPASDVKKWIASMVKRGSWGTHNQPAAAAAGAEAAAEEAPVTGTAQQKKKQGVQRGAASKARKLLVRATAAAAVPAATAAAAAAARGSPEPTLDELEAAEALQSFSMSISTAIPSTSDARKGGSVSPAGLPPLPPAHQGTAAEDGASSPPQQQEVMGQSCER